MVTIRRAEAARSGHSACVPLKATDLFKLMLRDEVAPALRSAGLRGSGSGYSIPSESHWAMLGFQGSMANTAGLIKFTVNCTVVRKDEWEAQYAARPYIGPKPKPNVRAGVGWTERLGALMPSGQDSWWWLERDGDPHEVAAEVVTAIMHYGLPAMRAEIAATS